ncbi:hypothetical protein Y032_0247g48 [Ancylostoma ceylanicum]|uniref:Ion transport domain-containing protein n=1 Tax=Ancylostoma ceylanicum TaxID=53326 RepID=A0A016SDJ6_9BILA|nr:hypothetical protein Y032_0247g48 [Ancylostoma ceylanicum]
MPTHEENTVVTITKGHAFVRPPAAKILAGGQSNLEEVLLIQQISTYRAIMDHVHFRSPAEVMMEHFLEERCCNESEIRREVVVASIPYIVICILIFLYVVFGAFTFSVIDDFMDEDTFATKCFFIFTTLTTIELFVQRFNLESISNLRYCSTLEAAHTEIFVLEILLNFKVFRDDELIGSDETA